MALPQGINFRGNLAYVTDGSDEHCQETVNADYPVTSAQGNNVGWESPGVWDESDLDNTNDRRLAGAQWTAGTRLQADYRIDLPSSGSHTVRVAAGHATSGSNAMYVDLLDTTGVLANLVTIHSGVGAQNFYDATDTVRSNTDWPTQNSSETHTFSTTICRFRIGDNSTGNCRIAHVYIEASGGGGGDPIRIRFPAQTEAMGVGGMLGGSRVY